MSKNDKQWVWLCEERTNTGRWVPMLQSVFGTRSDAMDIASRLRCEYPTFLFRVAKYVREEEK